jgi:hypothetical protein
MTFEDAARLMASSRLGELRRSKHADSGGAACEYVTLEGPRGSIESWEALARAVGTSTVYLYLPLDGRVLASIQITRLLTDEEAR